MSGSTKNGDEGLFESDDEEEDDEDFEPAPAAAHPPKKRKAATSDAPQAKKSRGGAFIDDAAQESGSENDDDEDDDDELDDEDEGDYIKDGFVVDEDEDDEEDRKERKAKKGLLEDSDDEDDDDEDEDGATNKRKRTKKLKKLKDYERLDEDDLALIHEAQGIREKIPRPEDMPVVQEERPKEAVRAQDADELRKGLFFDSEDELTNITRPQQQQQQQQVERYDEDGMDDFIDDDIGDQGDIMASERGTFRDESHGGRGGGVSEAQLSEAAAIFGTDYLDFMGKTGGHEDDDDDEENLLGREYRERGVGVDLGVDSDDEELISEDDDDDDLFGDDDDDDYDGTGPSKQQRQEALKLKREKVKLQKAERRKLLLSKKTERRKARLRRAFEPVQLVENFCTEKDDEIRSKDVPERFFDWTTPFYGGSDDTDSTKKEITTSETEEEEAIWIMSRIPKIKREYLSPPPTTVTPANSEDLNDALNPHQKTILNSIVFSLRYMHHDKLEPDFIKRYRADYVTSPAVRDTLYDIMDQDAEWAQMMQAQEKVDHVLASITSSVKGEEEANAEQENVTRLSQELQAANTKLDETVKQENDIKGQLQDFADLKEDDDDEDDDDLFGNDDDGDDDDEDEAKKARKKQKANLMSHLDTVKSLIEERGQRVAEVEAKLMEAEARYAEAAPNQGTMETARKMCLPDLWNSVDYQSYLSCLTDFRHILDINGYLSLVKEGNDAIIQKESRDSGRPLKEDARKRSRRFNRDFYRTCVAEGLRAICYKFVLSPFRAGIKLEGMTPDGSFDYGTQVPGEEGEADPLKWVAPTISDTQPDEFASKLIGSGELVLLSQGDTDDMESKDPLRGCRYVAAMELAYEPRVRRYLRNIFREKAVLTTMPTKKGMDAIDVFHEYYGLHLIRDKPFKEHFPMDEKESERRKAGLGMEEWLELEAELQRQEQNSCLQYLNILKAEQTGDIYVCIHMPLEQPLTEIWFKQGPKTIRNRDNQDLSPLLDVLKKVYMPFEGDTEEWNEERIKILRFALTNFLLPQFEAEARREMREAATKVGVVAAAENLRTMAMEGPYRPASMLGENRFLVPTGDLPLVGVCCASDGKDATFLASVTDLGELNDHLAIPSGQRVDDDKMREKVINFLVHSRPAAVVVGTHGGLNSRQIARKIGDLVAEAMVRWNTRFIQGEDEDDEEFEDRKAQFLEMNPRDMDEDDSQWKCNVDLVDDSVAQLFGRSVRGKKEFPDMHVNLKCAIATARHAKDPLAELTYAWNVASDAGAFGTEMLYLNIHPMQRLLPKTLLLRQYERVLCSAVADVGVDVNTACTHDHLLGLLSFVPGLGPRKAANLKQNVARTGGIVSSRRSILAKRLVGPIVYNNAIAFLRIREIEQLSNQFLHPLDNTRLHPDVYIRNSWAIKIAIDALERLEDDGDKGADKDALAIKALHDVMENSAQEVERLFKATKIEWEIHYGQTFNVPAWDPRENVPADQWRDKVEELDLEAFAAMIAENGQGLWLTHLGMIKWEYRLPFEDPRKPMEPLSGDKLFRLLTGENDQSLRPGKEVTGKVIRNGDFGSRVKLEGDIPGFIPLRNLADDHVEAAEDVVTVGSVVHAIVMEVKKDHITVDLSLRMEDFRKPQTSWERPESLLPLDTHFDLAAAVRAEEEKGLEREARLNSLQIRLAATKIGDDDENGERPKRRGGRVTRRACAHPAFRNASNNEVNQELLEAGEAMVGEALIRPSSKSSDSLAIHWVVRPDTIKVIEVAEEGKDTDASIGKVLKIKNEAYGSIDELIGRYIAPMNDYVEELTNHRKLVDTTEDDLDTKLKEQKEANPSGVFYNICWDESHPGYASLRFITGSTPRSHYIGIQPNGFSWGPTTYSSLDKLLNEFKKNPLGSSSRSAASGTSSLRSSTTTTASVPATVTPKPSRWGAKAPSAPLVQQHQPPPPAWTPAPPVIPAVVAAAAGGGLGWGTPSAAAAASGWSQPPPPSLPLPPPPRTNFQPPPPPSGGPPPPPPQLSVFAEGRAPQDSSRRRGVSNLPAWMTQQQKDTAPPGGGGGGVPPPPPPPTGPPPPPPFRQPPPAPPAYPYQRPPGQQQQQTEQW